MIDVEERAGIAVVTMRHGKANALDLEFCKALTDCLEGLKDGPSQGVILTSEGNIFSAGVDLLRALDEGPDYFRIFLPALHALYETLFFFPKPVVAAINGHAIAGGCVLACCADRRVMVRGQGRIGVTELLVGLPFPHLAFEIMRFATASHRFEEVMVGAATYPPQDGYERGLVNLLVEPGTLAEQALGGSRKDGRDLAAGLRPHQAPEPQAGRGRLRARRPHVRGRRDGDLDASGILRARQELCRAHAEEGLKAGSRHASAPAATLQSALPPVDLELLAEREADEMPGDDVLQLRHLRIVRRRERKLERRRRPR